MPMDPRPAAVATSQPTVTCGGLVAEGPATDVREALDVFRDHGERHVRVLREAGVEVRRRRRPGLPPGSADLDLLLPEIASEYVGSLAIDMRALLRLPADPTAAG